MFSIWWCNQGKLRFPEYKRFNLTLWDYERHHHVVCSQYDERKNINKFRESVGQVKKGDIVVHYVSPHILAISRAKTNGRGHKGIKLKLSGYPPLDYDYYEEDVYPKGWIFETQYHDFESPILLDQTLKKQILELNMPDNPIGYGQGGNFAVKRPGYFRPFNIRGLQLIFQASHDKDDWPDWVNW